MSEDSSMKSDSSEPKERNFVDLLDDAYNDLAHQITFVVYVVGNELYKTIYKTTDGTTTLRLTVRSEKTCIVNMQNEEVQESLLTLARSVGDRHANSGVMVNELGTQIDAEGEIEYITLWWQFMRN